MVRNRGGGGIYIAPLQKSINMDRKVRNMYFHKNKIIALLLTFIIVVMQLTVISQNEVCALGESGNLFYDDFDSTPETEYFDTSLDPNSTFNLIRQDGVLKAVKTGGDNYIYFTIPASVMKSADVNSDKFIVEWQVDAATGSYLENSVYINGTMIYNTYANRGNNPITTGTYYVVYDSSNHSAQYIYPDGTKKEKNGVNADGNEGFELGFQICNYMGNLTYDYIKVYPFGGMDAKLQWEAEDGAERDRIDLVFSDEIILDGVNLEDYLFLDNVLFTGTVEQSTENPLVYTLVFGEPLELSSNHTISISNLPCIMHQSFSKNLSFAVKGPRLDINIELESGNFEIGSQKILAKVFNETTESELILIAAVYSENGKMKLFENYSLPIYENGIYDFELELQEVKSGDILELYAVRSLEKLDIVGTKTIYSDDGISFEKKNKIGSVESTALAVCNQETLNEEITVLIPGGEDDRYVTLVVLKPGTTKVTTRNILYCRSKMTVNKEAVFKVELPDTAAIYPYIYYSQDEEPKVSEFKFFGKGDNVETGVKNLFYDEFESTPVEEYFKSSTADRSKFPSLERTESKLRVSKNADTMGENNWAEFVIPADMINADAYTGTDKFIIEWDVDLRSTYPVNRISINGSDKIGYAYNSAEVTEGLAQVISGKHYVVYDRKVNTAAYYWSEEAEPQIVRGIPSLPDGAFSVTFETTTVGAGYNLYDYIKVYPYNGIDTQLRGNESEGISPFGIDIIFSGDVIIPGTDIADFLLLDGEMFGGTVAQDEENSLIYTITFAEPLEYGSVHTLELMNIPCIMYQRFSKKMEFVVRDKKIHINLSLEDEGLFVGTQKITAEVINETDVAEMISVIAVIYSKDGAMKLLEIYPISTATGIYDFDFTVADVQKGDVLELYAAGSLKRLEMTGTKTVYSDNGISYETKPVIESIVKSEAAAVCDTENSVEKITITLPENQTERYVSLVVLKPGTTELLEENVYYLGSKISENGKAVFTLPVADETKSYSYIWYSQNEALNTGKCFNFYKKEFAVEGLGKINSASGSEMKGYMNIYAEALGIVVPDEDESVLDYAYKALAGLRDESFKTGFSTPNEVADTFETALFIAAKGNGNIENFVKEFNDKYKFDEDVYEVYNSYISTNAKNTVNSKLASGEVYSIEEIRNFFNEKVVLDGNYYAQNFSQTKKIIEALHKVIGIDLSVYNILGETNKSKVSQLITAKEHKTLTEFINAFNSACDKVKNNSSGTTGSSGGLGGGGGGASGGKGSGGSSSVTPGIYTTEISPDNSNTKKYSTFSDMIGYEWAIDYIEEYYDKGIINGKSADNFAPADNITRAEIAKILTLALELKSDGTNEKNDFSDVSKDHWAYSYISVLSEKGIINGVNEGVYGVDMPLTREMLITILYRAAGEPEALVTIDFDDIKDAEEYSKEAIRYYQSKGAVEGTGDNKFMPKSQITRAEAVVMTAKCLNVK